MAQKITKKSSKPTKRTTTVRKKVVSKKSQKTQSIRKTTIKAKSTTKKKTVKAKSNNPVKRFFARIWQAILVPVGKLKALRNRRSHKSFSRSMRRDYVRPLDIPGYIKFTSQVIKTLYDNRSTFILLSIVVTIIALLISLIGSHSLYNSMVDSFNEQTEVTSTAAKTSMLALSSAMLLAVGAGEAQQISLVIVGLIAWMTTVWLLRDIMAGRTPRMRDGLYSAGSPLVATGMVALIALVQLLPIGIIASIGLALGSTGLISQGLGMFLYSGIFVLVFTLTLYWLTATFFAGVIVTLPGVYPWQAMRAASDIVVGRRLRMLFRLLWVVGMIVVIWMSVMVPVVTINTFLVDKISWFKNVPLVPVLSAWLFVSLVIWLSAYIYILYREVVASDAESSV